MSAQLLLEQRDTPIALASSSGVSRGAIAPVAGGGLGSIAVAIAWAAGMPEPWLAAVGIGAGALPGLVHGLVAAGGVRGALALLWHGRR